MDCYSHPQANHKQSVHSYFLSIGCLGTGNICQEWDEEIDSPVFSAVPLANYWISVDDKGRISKCFRRIQWTKAQATARFGEENLPPRLNDVKVKDDEKWDFIHCVLPRKEYDPAGKGTKDMPWRSSWIFIGGALIGGGGGSPATRENPYICWEGGYRTFPYHVGRWEIIEGQEYGRSPAMTALPAIKDLNQMKKVSLRAGQKNVDPPMIAPHDAFMSQLDMTPGAVNYYDSYSGLPPDAFRPIVGNPQAADNAEKLMAPEIMAIERIFYTDLGSIPFKKERQTTTEINAQQDSILRNVAPLVGRQEAEEFGPMIMRTYDLCSQWGKIPPHPVKMKGKKLKIVYVSRAARAIKGSRLAAIRGYIAETLVPMIQVAPEVKDKVNCDAVLQISADLAFIDMGIFRSDEDVAKIRKDRAAQQQAQAQQQMADSASNSLKNVAQASQAAPDLVGAGQS
jgi:hypothetical protein